MAGRGVEWQDLDGHRDPASFFVRRRMIEIIKIKKGIEQ